MSCKPHDMRRVELAMRCLLLVKARAVGNAFCLFDLAEAICDRFSVSRASGYRYARLGVDVLGIDMSMNEARRARRDQRVGKKMGDMHHA